jgi:O-antigen/teichoic acid export membrane protein
VAFPVLAEVVRERPDELPRQFRRVRFPLVLMSLTAIVSLMVIAKPLINLLYHGEYEKAGPILQVLAIGALGSVLNTTYGSVLLAMGKTFDIMALLVTYIIFLVAGTLLGYHWYGEVGFIWGVALVEWLNYPANAAVLARHGLWQPRLDAAVVVVSVAAVALVFWVFP